MINNNKCAMNTIVDIVFNLNLAEIFMQQDFNGSSIFFCFLLCLYHQCEAIC